MSQPAASNKGTSSGAMKVACAELRLFWHNKLLSCRDQPRGYFRRSVLTQQQAPPRHWVKALQSGVGVIMSACALPCVGPGMVKHIFALAVALQIGGQAADGCTVRPSIRIGFCLPAGAGANAARFGPVKIGIYATGTDHLFSRRHPIARLQYWKHPERCGR